MLTLIKLAAALFVTLLVQFIPLVGAYHYESALSIALIGLVFVPIISPRRTEETQFWFFRALGTTLLFLVLANGAALAAAWLRNDLCDITSGVYYQLLIALPSVLLSTAVWGWSSSLSRFSSVRVLTYLFIVALDFVFALYALYQWPPLVAFGQFFGYFAGSIYDEAIDVTKALCIYRLGTCIVLGCFISAQCQGTRLWKRIVLALAAIAVAAGYQVGLARLEIIPPMGREALEDALWTQVEAPDGAWVVHYKPSTRHVEERRLHEAAIRAEYARDFAQLEAFFETRPTAPLHIWLYPDYDEKARFLAARHTSFARVWKHEIHLVESSPLSTTPRHEMAHLFAEAFGNRPLGLAGAWGIPAMGWVEGLAMAAEWPIHDYDLHTWSAAILAHGERFPQPSPIGMLYGFWSLPPRVAYTLAGSYVRWLIDTYGIDKVKQLSQTTPGHFEDIIPDGFHATFEAWKTFLHQKRNRDADETVELMFGSRSIWTKTCARHSAASDQAFYRCLQDVNCPDTQLYACSPSATRLSLYPPEEMESEDPAQLERDWQLYVSLGTDHQAVGNTPSAAAMRADMLQKLKNVEFSAPLEALIWDERRADMLWHAGFYLPAAFAYHAILTRSLPKATRRRMEIKRQAAWYHDRPVSKDIRRWFAATDEETRSLLYARSDHAPVMAWLEFINALSSRRFARAQHALMQIWLHYGDDDPASALPPSALDELIHAMSHLPTFPTR